MCRPQKEAKSLKKYSKRIDNFPLSTLSDIWSQQSITQVITGNVHYTRFWVFWANCVNINLIKLRTNCLFCSSHSSHGEHNMAFVRDAPSFWLKETVSTVWDSLFMGRYPDGSNEAFLLTTHLLKIPSHHKI